MNTTVIRIVKRFAIALVAAGGLGGCAVYGPPYAAAYDPYYYSGYGYPAYVGPPVSLNFGYGYYDRGYRHSHGPRYGGRSHGWGRHGGWSSRGGGWGHGRGRR